jgi:arylsulfatase A-like enzyme
MTATSTALSIAFLDLTLAILPGPSDLASLSALWPALGATAILAFILCGCLCAVGSVVPRARALAPPAAVSITVFLAGLFRFASPDNTFLSFYDCRPGPLLCPPYALKLAVPLICASIAAGAVLWAIGRSERTHANASRLASLVPLAMPFLLGEMCLASWFIVYAGRSRFAAVAIDLSALALLAATVLLVRRFGMAGRMARAVVALGLVVVAFGAVPPALTLVQHARESRRPARSALPPAPAASAGRRIKHVLLITIDALRADALSCYRPGAGPTPNIDSLAAQGAVFMNAMSSANWTLPAFGSMMTGFSPWVHRTTLYVRPPGSLPMLAELLRDAGYDTAAFVANPLLGPESGFLRGFTHYTLFETKPRGEAAGNAPLGARILQRVFAPKASVATSSDLTAAAIAFIKDHLDTGTFTWIHYMDPHGPYVPPASYVPGTLTPAPVPEAEPGLSSSLHTPEQKAWAQALYNAEVRAADGEIGGLLRGLASLGAARDSLIVLTADHGEAFWEHGYATHGNGLFQELLHVPLIIRHPMVPPGRRIDAVVTTTSLPPTILSLCGVPSPPPKGLADSLASLLTGSPAWPTLTVSASIGAVEEQIAVMFDRYKYIRSIGSGREELFDLARDPGEQMSLALVSPDVLATGRALADQHLGQADDLRRQYRVGGDAQRLLDEDQKRRLRALGYLR